jgi:hypothetical protein
MGVNIDSAGRRTLIIEPEWFPRPDGTERAVLFQPGYNDDRTGPHSCGVHGMEITWYLRGPRGAVQFKTYTSWTPGVLRPGHGRMPVGYPPREADQYPNGADLGYHARVPQYDEQEAAYDDCPIIGGPCYYDGSGLAAQRLAEQFTEHGESVIWAKLEENYAQLEVPDGVQ